MTERAFNPSMSTNEIWRGDETTRCLTDDLDAMDAIHTALPNTYAAKNHEHEGYLTDEDIAPIPIENGTDLNNIMDVGTYCRYATESDTNTVLNTPPAMYASTFLLEVLKAGGGTQLIQRATRCHKSSKATAERTFYSGSWGDWETTYINGNRVLWNGWYWMSANQTASLSCNISDMAHGVVLVFSGYNNDEPCDYDWQSFYVPKYQVINHGGCGTSFMLSNSNCAKIGHKYIYIHDNKLVGHANNIIESGNTSGITWNNKYFVLRYVLGV